MNFKVSIVQCIPTVMSPTLELKNQLIEIGGSSAAVNGTDTGSSNSTAPSSAPTGDVIINTPQFRQSPDCSLPIDYRAEGLTNGIEYDNKNNKLTVDQGRVASGKY